MKILITDKTENAVIQQLKDAGHEVTFNEMDPATLQKEISNYDGLMVRSRTKVTADVITAAKGKLKVIGRAGIGVDNIDLPTASKHHIKVVNAPTGTTESVAELAFGLMLAASRSIPQADHSMKRGLWEKKAFKGVELCGKTLGIIGIGRIGTELGKRALAFKMKVLAYDKYIQKSPAEKIEIVPLETVLTQSDYISLHIPFVKQEGATIKDHEFELMKNGVIIINCARGGVVDEPALLKQLNAGKVQAAALDVYAAEPPTFKELVTHPKVICTPHIGASTKEGQLRAGKICAEQMLLVLSGKTPEFWVNKKMME
ncbi:MAG: phosphoglycerate dehydrogenase [Candidatus Thermoplasmatota archaeon]|nr:phosphoglycerate dehydrogenase [Candidatus Thermoplasmatota archaeon]